MINKELTHRNLTFSDLGSVVLIHKACFPESLLTQMGENVLRRYYEWQLSAGHPFFYSEVIFENNQPAGFCIGGALRGAMGGFLKKNKGLLCITLLTRPQLILRGKYFKKIITGVSSVTAFRKKQVSPPKIEQRRFGILAIAVHPNYRRSGIGKKLLSLAERCAVKNNFKEMHLTVEVENRGAIAFYEKLGWVKKPHSQTDEWMGEMVRGI